MATNLLKKQIAAHREHEAINPPLPEEVGKQKLLVDNLTHLHRTELRKVNNAEAKLKALESEHEAVETSLKALKVTELKNRLEVANKKLTGMMKGIKQPKEQVVDNRSPAEVHMDKKIDEGKKEGDASFVSSLLGGKKE